MCLLASPRHFRSLAIVPLLMAILAFPASAQTTDPNGMGPANVRGQSELTSGPTSSNPATQKTDPNSAAPSTQTNSSATKAEPESGGSQSESIPGSKKAGSAILIDINKAKQKMTVLWMGYKNTTGRYQQVERDILPHQELILRPL